MKQSAQSPQIVGISANPAAGGADRIFLSILSELNGKAAIAKQVKEILAPQNDSVVGIDFPEMSNNIRSISKLLFAVFTRSFLPKSFLKSVDVVMLCDLRAVILFAPLLRLKKIPVLFHCHASWRHIRRNRFVIGRLLNVFTTKIVVPSAWMANELKLFGTDPHKISVIHNGFQNSDSITASFTDSHQVFMPGDIQHQKGQMILCESIKILRSRSIAVTAIFAGRVADTSYFDLLKTKYADLFENGTLTYVGKISHDILIKTMGESHVCCALSTSSETFPTVLLEAMAVGIPVVGSRIGGIPEIISDTTTGFIVEPENPEQTANVLEQLLLFPKQAEQMGLTGKKMLTDKFSFEQSIEQFRTVISEITAQR